VCSKLPVTIFPPTPIAPDSVLYQPAAAPVASPIIRLPTTPTIVANTVRCQHFVANTVRCQQPLPTAVTTTAAPPHHDTGLIPMAQPPTRGGRVGTSAPTNNGRIDQKPQPESRPPRLAMSPVPTAVWQHRSDLSEQPKGSAAEWVGGRAWLGRLCLPVSRVQRLTRGGWAGSFLPPTNTGRINSNDAAGG
jgi:hypothetical protein